MPFVFSQMKAATGSPAAGIAAFLPSEGADAAHVGTVYKTAVHSIKIDHGPMPANDALAFIIRRPKSPDSPRRRAEMMRMPLGGHRML